MKSVLASLIVLSASVSAFAATSKLDLIKNNVEVKGVIANFESNRNQKCREISSENVQVSKNGIVKVSISCNQYDENGEPQANVHFITIKGNLYPDFFEMNTVAIVGAE